MTQPSSDPFEKFWYLAKIGYVAVTIFFTLMVVFFALLTGDPNALVGLIFPIFMAGLGFALWVAVKVHDRGHDDRLD